MKIMYGFSYNDDNELVAYAVDEKKEVHLGRIGDYGGYKKVPVKGNTYPVKENIKATDWTKTKYDWTGDVWAVSAKGLRDIIEAVLEVYDEVSAVKDTVRECDELSEFHQEIRADKRTDEVIKFVYNVIGAKDDITREMAEMAASKGNYESPEEFANDFGYNIVPKEEFFGWAGDDDEEDDGLIGSSKGGVV